MKKWLGEVARYAWLCFRHVDFICGGIIAVGYFFVADQVALAHHGATALVIVAAAYVAASYSVYAVERRERLEQEVHVTVRARLGSYSANVPDPGPDKSRIQAHVFWEVWTDQDISTERLALNVIYFYDQPWWKPWARRRQPRAGIPPDGSETTDYRKRYGASDPQPIQDNATFEYVADRYEAGDPHWLLELVLLTGMPRGVYRVPVWLDYEELRTRGAHPPL